jgi:hypothetical protein
MPRQEDADSAEKLAQAQGAQQSQRGHIVVDADAACEALRRRRFREAERDAEPA